MDKNKIGKLGENLAADFLIRNSYKVIAKNYHSRFGEIDLIAEKDELIYFIEVKTRTSQKFGPAEFSVDTNKRERILKTIQDYIFKNKTERGWAFGVVAVYLNMSSRMAKIKHYPAIALF